MLAEHPEVLRRLRQEILEKIGPQRRPTYDDFRDMKFLRAVINGAFFLLCRLLTCYPLEQETLRLYPVVYVVVSPLCCTSFYIDGIVVETVLSMSGRYSTAAHPVSYWISSYFLFN